MFKAGEKVYIHVPDLRISGVYTLKEPYESSNMAKAWLTVEDDNMFFYEKQMRKLTPLEKIL